MAKRERIEIKSALDLEDVMTDMFDEFLESIFYNDNYSEPVDHGNSCFYKEEGITRLWRDNAMCLIDRYQKRMRNVFEKHYPEHTLSIRSSYYKEF